MSQWREKPGNGLKKDSEFTQWSKRKRKAHLVAMAGLYAVSGNLKSGYDPKGIAKDTPESTEPGKIRD